jgi:hypothetical protein
LSDAGKLFAAHGTFLTEIVTSQTRRRKGGRERKEGKK